MKLPTSHWPGALALGAVFILAACSGGDSMSPGVTTSAAAPASSITAANAQEVAAQAVFASDGLTAKPGNNSTVVTGAAVDADSGGLVDTTLQQMDKVMASGFFNKALKLTETTSVNCPQGGTATATINAKNAEQFSTGDSISIAATNCNDGNNAANGTITIHFDSVTGTPSADNVWSTMATLTFTNVTVKKGNISRLANGTAKLTYNQTAFRMATFTLASNSLQLLRSTPGTTSNRTLTNLNTSGSVNGTTFTYRTSFTVAGNFPQFGQGAFAVTTPTDFVQQSGADPSQGVLKVTAANGSNLTLTAVAPSNVNVAVDTNGDGTADATTTTTWNQLAATAKII